MSDQPINQDFVAKALSEEQPVIRKRLAVGIPTMNRPDYLRNALKSVAAQTRLPDDIYILDNSANADEGVGAEFPELPIRYEHLPERIGVEAAIHRVLAGAKGDYVALLEDDNLWLLDHLEQLERGIQKYPEAGLYATLTEYAEGEPLKSSGRRFTSDWPEVGPASEMVEIPSSTAAAMTLFYTPFSASAVLINKRVFELPSLVQGGFSFLPDRWLWGQLGIQANVVMVRKVTVLFRLHEGQLSHHLSRKQIIEENGRIVRVLYRLMQENGINPEQGTTDFGKGLTKATQARWTVELVRSRQWQIVDRLLPHFRQSKGDLLLWPCVFWDMVHFYLGRLTKQPPRAACGIAVA